jgi:hypothetical protein
MCSKNKLFHLQIYIALNTFLFVCEMSSFDAVFYFLCNLIISETELQTEMIFIPALFISFPCYPTFRLSDRPVGPYRSDNRDFTVPTDDLNSRPHEEGQKLIKQQWTIYWVAEPFSTLAVRQHYGET